MRKMKIPKGGGKFRLIYVPDGEEMRQLRQLLPELNKIAARVCPYAHAFIAGRSPITAALVHRKAQWLLSCDIMDWFDNVRSDQIVREGVPARVLNLILVDGAPRQGLPTSPAAANIAAAAFDRRVVEQLPKDCTYARYADDISVGCQTREAVDEARKIIEDALREEGWTPHPSKWSLQWRGAGRLVVCGVVVDETGKVTPTREFRRRLRAAEHQTKLSGMPATPTVRGMREWGAMREPLQAALVRRHGGREPLPPLVKALDIQEARGEHSTGKRTVLRKQITEIDLGAYRKALKYIEDNPVPGYSANVVAMQLVSTFGASWEDWVKGARARGASLHDAVYWLPRRNNPGSGLGAALFRWRREIPDLLGRTTDLSIVASAWPYLRDETRKLPFSKLLHAVRASANYPRAMDYAFAKECSRWGVAPDEYLDLERRWIKYKAVPYDAIPRGVAAKLDDLTATILERDDPRVLWAGYHTNCCQHPGGAGSSCAWHAALSPDGAILAVFAEGSDRMVAQSWLWRAGDIVVADNIEKLRRVDRLAELYEMVGDYLMGRMGIKQFRVGSLGHLPFDAAWPVVPNVKPVGYRGYTDAVKQYLVRKVPDT